MKAGKADLKGTKYDWLSNPKNMTRRQKQRFKALRDSTLKTARAWAIKELAMSLWGYVSKTWARKGWARWLSWAVRCRLEPMKKVAKTIKKHLWGILNAIVLKVSNGPAEGINSPTVTHPDLVKSQRIYQHVYEDKRRGGDLHRHLRCQKPRRKRYGHYDRRGQIRERVSIDERPEVVEGAQPHW